MAPTMRTISNVLNGALTLINVLMSLFNSQIILAQSLDTSVVLHAKYLLQSNSDKFQHLCTFYCPVQLYLNLSKLNNI